jgi:hypothetical protein
VTTLSKGNAGTTYSHTTEVDAAADGVWSLLEDLPGYAGWNPVYTRASGDVRPGAEVRLTVQLPGMKPTHAKATVAAAVPGQRLVLRSAMLGGLIKADRSFALSPLGSGRCTLVGSETFHGPAAWLIAKLVGTRVDQAVRWTNEALKAAAERNAGTA